MLTIEAGYCPGCQEFYPETGTPFQRCPKDEGESYSKHRLLHPQVCSLCHRIVCYEQSDDDYCGPEITVCMVRKLERELRKYKLQGRIL